MKLFSRKGIVAAAASAALVSGVFAAPAMAEDNTPVASQTQAATGGSSDIFSSLSSDGDVDTTNTNSDDPAEGSSASDLGDWISVFTAVIGALSALFGFIALF